MSKQLLLSASLLVLCLGAIAAPHQASAQISLPSWPSASGHVAAGCAVPSAAPSGKTWYIDPVNGSATGDGSAAHPWNSLSAIVLDGYISTMPSYWDATDKKTIKVMPNAPIHPGDTILLASGNYGNITIQGSYGQTSYPIAGYDNSDFITIEAAPGATPVLGQLLLAGGGKWVFRGLTIENTQQNLDSRAYGTLVKFDGLHHDIIFDHNTVRTPVTASDLQNWTQTDWANNTSSGIGDEGSGYNGANCISITSNTLKYVSFGIQSQRSNNVLIEGNTINYFVHDGIDYASNNMVIRHNLETNRIDAGDLLIYHPDFMQGQPYGSTDLDTLSNILIDSNIAIRQTDPNLPFPTPMIQGIDEFDGQWYNVTVTNNIIITSTYQGIAYYGVHGAVIANNILLADGFTPAYVPWITVQDEKATEKANTPSSDVVVRNNIASGLNYAVDTTNLSFDHNLCVLTNGSCTMQLAVNGVAKWYSKPGTYAGNNVIDQYGAPALFNNFTLTNGVVTGLDLRLKADTPAVGTGDATDAPLTDITGAARTAPYDLGAYMFAEPTNGACGTDTGKTLQSAPVNLCSTGTASAVTSSNVLWAWSCSGSNGGATSSCSAYKEVSGACGTAAGASSAVAPTSNLCSAGTPSGVIGGKANAGTSASPVWTWSCAGLDGGTTVACAAPEVINGVCGASNGTSLTTTPTTGLCATGTASKVTGTGPWSWSCLPQTPGRTSATCSASKPYNGTVKIIANGRQDGAPQMIVKVDGKVVGTAAVTADVHVGQVGTYTFNFTQPTHPTKLEITLDGYTSAVQKYVSLNAFNVNFGVAGTRGTDVLRTGQGTVENGTISLSTSGAAFETNGSTLEFNVAKD